jgi:hypothetical protein
MPKNRIEFKNWFAEIVLRIKKFVQNTKLNNGEENPSQILIHTPVCMGLIQFIAEKKQFIKF